MNELTMSEGEGEGEGGRGNGGERETNVNWEVIWQYLIVEYTYCNIQYSTSKRKRHGWCPTKKLRFVSQRQDKFLRTKLIKCWLCEYNFLLIHEAIYWAIYLFFFSFFFGFLFLFGTFFLFFWFLHFGDGASFRTRFTLVTFVEVDVWR